MAEDHRSVFRVLDRQRESEDQTPRDFGPPVFSSARTKLFLLIALALAPVAWFQARDITKLRDQRIEQAKHLALEIAQRGANREQALVSEATALLDVAVETPAIRDADVAACAALLHDIKQRSPWADGFGLIDMRGHPVCSHDATFRDVDLSDREYFREALRSDQVFVSAFLISRSSGRPNIVLARSVRNPAGRQSGVLIGTIDLDWLKELVTELDESGGGSTMLLDRNGTVLALSPDPEHLVGHNFGSEPAIAEGLMSRHPVDEEISSDGVARLRAVATIPGSGERIVVSFDRSAVLAEANAEVSRSFQRLAILLVGAGILAWLGGEVFFLRWMRPLMRAAHRLGRGDFTITAGIPRVGGELAVLGRALEAAASQLGQRDDALRQAQIATRDAEALFRGVFVHSTDGLFVSRLDADGGFRFEAMNEAASLILSVSADDVIGRRLEDTLNPASAAHLIADLARAVASGHPMRFDDDRMLNGSARSWEVLQIPLRDENGTINRVFVGLRDISHLKKAEDAARAASAEAREANRLLRLAEQMTHVGHWHIDGGTDTLFWSDEVYRIHGYLPGDIQPARDWARTAYHPVDRNRVTDAIRAALAGVGFVRYEARVIRPDGEIRHVRVRGFCQSSDQHPDKPSLFGTLMDVTELRKAERDAAETSNVLTATLDSMDQGLMVVSKDGRIEVCNTKAIALLDLPADLIASRPSLDTVLHRFASIEIAKTETGAPENGLMRLGGATADLHTHVHIRPNGTVIEVCSMPMPNGGVVRTFTDITARRAAEQAIQESETRHRLLAETTTDVITQLDLEFRRIYVSSACRKVLGFEPEELLDQRPSAMMHPDDAALAQQFARRLLAGTVPNAEATISYRTRHKMGHWVWIEAGMTLVRDQNGEPNSIVCSLRDVSERKFADIARAETESLYRLLSEHSTDMIVQADLDTTWSYVSPASRELLGYEPSELVGTSPLDFVHPDDSAACEATFDRLTSASVDVATSLQRYRRKDGTYVWTEATYRSLKTETGSPLGYVAAVRDVSVRQAQAEALEMARAQAEQASQAKTDFLASMSHEIRTPLNGILGYADLLIGDPDLNAPQRHQAERIQSAGAALLTIVNDILDFSTIEAGRVELDRQVFGLEALIDNAVSIIRGIAISKRIEMTVDIDDTVPKSVVGDPNRLRQILLNLFNNAVKFTPAGRVSLHVSRMPDGLKNGLLHFTVTDTGIGISQDKLDRLFQRFSQIDPSIRREFGGTGLGLAISKSLVELMGGAIGVRSAVGQGSTFWFKVKLDVAHQSSVPVSPAPRRNARHARRLLLVEDLAMNQEIARAVLESMGHVVDTVDDGAESITAVQAANYDLILMDVQMPGMDGLTATRHIRALAHPAATTPILAMTANVLPAQVVEFRAAGMNDHIGKPFKRDELFEAIERWTAWGEAQRRSASPQSVGGDTFDQMKELLGVEKVNDLVSQLAALIAERLSDTALNSADPVRLATQAHAIVSTAGLLGFSDLSKACADLEAACRQGAPIDNCLAVVRTTRQHAIESLDILRQAA